MSMVNNDNNPIQEKLQAIYQKLEKLNRAKADVQRNIDALLNEAMSGYENKWINSKVTPYDIDSLRDKAKDISSEIKNIEKQRQLWERINIAYTQDETKLDLSGLEINVVPVEVSLLKKLTILLLSNNKLSELPAEIWQLRNLTFLNLSHNQITLLSPEIGRLTGLEELYLHGNRLSEIPDEIGQLTNLLVLTLGSEGSENRITRLPSTIGNLTKLQQLDLDNNQLTDLPSEIGRLSGLHRFGASRNRLTSLPTEIGQLVELRVLRLGYNLLAELPDEIQNLTHVERLWLNSNKISDLPRGLLKLNNLITLDLTNNSLPIAPEVLSKVSDPTAILFFYFGLRRLGQKRIDQARLLVLGQGSVGKTSLVEVMLFGRFDPNQMKTEGISIHRWIVKSEHHDQTPIKVNVWDFGGQEIMHATHQFFLTKRSLYLLVLDSRLTQEENRVEYWLKIIQSFGGESPVLIVGNKTDQHPLDIDRTGLQKKYPNIAGILDTSAATGAGIENLKTAINDRINNLPHVRDLLPETWFAVKTELEGLSRATNFITHDQYLELCAENEINDETSQRTLIGFLHDLGVVLHFQDDPRLETLGILNPQWVTNGVYKILNSHTLFQNKGVLTVAMLDEILNLPEYPRGKRLFIVDMMKKFELCYDIEVDQTFLVPDLLPKDEPADLKSAGVPAFEYAYSVLPSSVITRFIVRMNQHIHDNCVWRMGVVLKIGENTALVKADIEDRKITIAIDGLEHTRRDVLSAIRYQLDEIHISIKGLDARKRVPIPNAPNAEPLEYEYLLMLEREGQETHLVKDESRLVKINVREILSGIESEAQRRESGGNVTNIYVGGNFDGNLTVGDRNQSIKDSYNKITSAKIDPELKQTLKLLAEAVSAMTKAMADEQAAEVTENLGKLIDEATKPKPNQKWYSVSIEGLIKAAENVEKVGEPVINLSRKVLSLLTGGAIK